MGKSTSAPPLKTIFLPPRVRFKLWSRLTVSATPFHHRMMSPAKSIAGYYRDKAKL